MIRFRQQICPEALNDRRNQVFCYILKKLDLSLTTCIWTRRRSKRCYCNIFALGRIVTNNLTIPTTATLYSPLDRVDKVLCNVQSLNEPFFTLSVPSLHSTIGYHWIAIVVGQLISFYSAIRCLLSNPMFTQQSDGCDK
jgi:hypothetical protein